MPKIGINAMFSRKPATGIGQVVSFFLKQLSRPEESREGSDQNTYVLYTDASDTDMVSSERISVRSFLPFWKRDDVPRQWLWERKLSREALRDGCDVFLSLSQSATIFPKSDGIKHVMVVHDIIPRLFPEYLGTWSRWFAWRGVERGIRSADRIVAVSNTTKEDLIRELGIPENRIVVSHVGLSPIFDTIPDPDRLSETLSRYGLNKGYIYHGGGLEIRKNAESVLRAYVELYKERGESLPILVISGKVHERSNKLATDVEGLIEELDLRNQVKLLGQVPGEDLPSLLSGALCFVYPSLYEGFGLPPLEALSQGVPVIVSNVSSLPEVCGDAALYCDPKDKETLISALKRMLDDVSLREDLSRRGKERVRQFSPVSFFDDVLSCVKTLSQSKE